MIHLSYWRRSMCRSANFRPIFTKLAPGDPCGQPWRPIHSVFRISPYKGAQWGKTPSNGTKIPKSPVFDREGWFFACGDIFAQQKDPATQFFDFNPKKGAQWGQIPSNVTKILKLPIFDRGGWFFACGDIFAPLGLGQKLAILEFWSHLRGFGPTVPPL